MTCHAPVNWQRTRFPDLRCPHGFLSCIILAFGLTGASPAAAQLAASASVSSDDLFRGRSLSGGQPVATANLSYDWSNGFYAGVSATGIATAHSGAQFLGSQQFVGYARRIGSGRSLDVGVINSTYSHYFSGGYNADYTELYAGLTSSHISAHIHYSPNYFGQSISTVYGDLDGVIEPLATVRLNAHVGLLDRTSGALSTHGSRTHFDWRLGISKQFGRLDLHAAWAGASPRQNYYDGRLHGRTVLVAGATISF